MSMTFEEIKSAVFYSNEKPDVLANIIKGVMDSIPAVASEISLTPSASTVTIPTGDTAETVTISSVVKDQFGTTMGNKTATLALAESVTGVTLSEGTLSVAKTASAGSVVINATCDDATASVTITLEAGE